MATSTVSGSVDVNVKRLAGMHIRKKGTTANEVIKRVWEHIATTGEIPFVETDADFPEKPLADASQAFKRLSKLRGSVPSGTPLDSMDKEALKRELEARYE